MVALPKVVLVLVLCSSAWGCRSAPASDSPSGAARAVGLLSQDVMPSDAAQDVAVDDRLLLAFPAGALADAATLEVSELTGGALDAPNAREALAVYDIALGDTESLQQPLALTLYYDADDLDSERPPEEQLTVAYWDEEEPRWVTVPALVDAEAHSLTIHTTHLSRWGYFRWLTGYEVHPCLGPFMVIYDQEVVTAGSSASYQGPVADPQLSGLPPIVSDICSFLGTAYEAYKQAGFVMPAGVVNVEIGEYEDPYTAGYSGTIHMTLESWHDVSLLRQQAAHELFHAVQMEQLGTGTMSERRWWMEATAEYASSAVAWASIGGTGTMGGDIQPRYLESSITSRDSWHDYSTSHFIAYLVEQIPGLSFREIWDATAAGGQDVLESLDRPVAARSGLPLLTHYANFSRHYVYDAISPMPSVSSLSQEVASKSSEFLVEETEKTATLTVDYYASHLWAIGNQKTRDVTVEWQPGTYGLVEATVLSGDDRLSPVVAGPVGVTPGHPASLHLEPGQWLYLQVTNAVSHTPVEISLRVAQQAYPSGLSALSLRYDAGCDGNIAGGYSNYSRVIPLPVRVEGSRVTVDYDKEVEGKHLVATGQGSVDANGRLVLDVTATFTRTPCEAGVCPFTERLTAHLEADWNGRKWSGPATGSVSVDQQTTRGVGEAPNAFSCTAAPVSGEVRPGFVDRSL